MRTAMGRSRRECDDVVTVVYELRSVELLRDAVQMWLSDEWTGSWSFEAVEEEDKTTRV